MITPDFRLDLPRLGPVVAYRTLGIEDHIADKVCATMSNFGSRASSRSKDLVDLVIITQTVEIDSRQLRLSVLAEAIHRGIPVFTRISVPRSMADGYPKLARSVPLLADLLDPAIAIGVVNTMLHPSLSGEISEGRWTPEVQIWVRKRAFGK